jgi:hypothetical protein
MLEMLDEVDEIVAMRKRSDAILGSVVPAALNQAFGNESVTPS